MWLCVTLLLCATNILTLLDQDFRNRAYNALARAAASPVMQTIGLSALSRTVEERSPAAIEKRAVERATLRLVASTAVLQRQVAGLKGQNAVLVTQRQNLQKQVREGQRIMALHKDRIAKLGARVVRRAGINVTRRLAALPGHALPVLSATVAAGSVALDIHDACESLKELDELNQSVGLPVADRSGVCGKSVPTAQELLNSARSNWRVVYDKSAEALNKGAEIIPRAPPSISFEFAKEWLATTFRR